MIGNTIEFIHFHDYKMKFKDKYPNYCGDMRTGIVVDAFTEITGSVSGKSEGILGFSSGNVHGSTDSRRKYKVQTEAEFTGTIEYIDIYAWQLKKITKFANASNQESNEEKIIRDSN